MRVVLRLLVKTVSRSEGLLKRLAREKPHKGAAE
jgi:hypothetical protein